MIKPSQIALILGAFVARAAFVGIALITGILVLGSCEHNCDCTPKGTWAGATTVSTTGYSSITYICSDTAEYTGARERQTQCSYVCTERLRQQGVTSDYELGFGVRADACQADCEANAKLSTTCVQGARVNTLFGWN